MSFKANLHSPQQALEEFYSSHFRCMRDMNANRQFQERIADWIELGISVGVTSELVDSLIYMLVVVANSIA